VEWRTLAQAACVVIEFVGRHPVVANYVIIIEARLDILLYLLAFDSGLPTEQSFVMAVGHLKSQHMEFTGIRLHDLDVCAPHLVLLTSVLILSDFA